MWTQKLGQKNRLAEGVPNSNAQGAGMGRRGDISDGHAWAGGLGALIDLSGNDEYVSGNWAAGVGYWFGTGVLYDGEGREVIVGQRSGATTVFSGPVREYRWEEEDKRRLGNIENQARGRR